MAQRSKLDRLESVVRIAVCDAMDHLRLEAHAAGNHGDASVLRGVQDLLARRVVANMLFDTYKRLEICDIIKGHRRAWPDAGGPK